MSWATVGVVGVLLQLVGIVIALVGLDHLSGELFPGSSLPHRAAGRWVKRRLGIRPNPITLQVDPATETDTVFPIRVVTTKRRPSDAESQAAWNEYWDSRLSNLSDDIAALEQYVKEADNDLARRLKAEAAERHEGDARLEERVKVVVGGEGGSGLRLTFWGFAITGLGLAFQLGDLVLG